MASNLNLGLFFKGSLEEDPAAALQELMRAILIRSQFLPAVRHALGWRGLKQSPAELEGWTAKIKDHAGVFGLFFMGEYANIVIGSCMTTILFLGGWACPFGLFPGVWWFILKLYLLIATFIWIRWTFPRTTIYGLLNLSWKILIPLSLFNLLLTAGLIKVF